MRVAILGAGLSSLSCAKYLEDYNIEPVIFEKRHERSWECQLERQIKVKI